MVKEVVLCLTSVADTTTDVAARRSKTPLLSVDLHRAVKEDPCEQS